MQPLALLKYLGKALVRSAGNAVGFGIAGDVLVDAGEQAWQEWNQEKEEAARKEELRELLQMAQAEFRQQVEEVVREVAAGQPPEVQAQVSQGLQEVPMFLRQSLRRSADRSPADMPLPRSKDFISLLTSVRPQVREDSETASDDWDSTSASEQGAARLTLTLMSGPNKGEQFIFEERATCVIGRHHDCHPRFPKDKQHQAISRHHCLLDINLPDVSIRDFGSKHGTYLNGTLIGKRPEGMSAEEGKRQVFDDYPVVDGDEISLSAKGAARFQVALTVPPQCLECGTIIPEQEQARCQRQPGVYQCETCRQQAAQSELVRRCAQCNRDVMGEPGANRPGKYVCATCRNNLESLLQRFQHQGAAQPGNVPVIAGYTIRQKLGQGGMGEVWLAEHDKSNQLVAIKLVLPEVAADERSLTRALRELANNRLLRHPNVVQLLDVEYANGLFVMILEYCDGNNVAKLMRQRGGTLSVEEALPITLQALQGLDYAHHVLGNGNGLVHRDISPDNIFLAGQGSARVAKLGDYGLAKAFDDAGLSGSTRTGEVAGKPHFMPRVQVTTFKDVGPEVDVWAMAATLYSMLTGDVPRDFSKGGDPWLTVLEENPVPIQQRNPSLPSALASVIDDALREEPTLRFQSAKAFEQALQQALEGR